ncbi:thioredoxin [Cryobacterium adonitolivorans]|uniref:Thioredoxin n=1 Tax=Cryobacterium adonitolivorans TaxID=1259189 RepID=A0A4R8W0X4_9MICO|nr:thioredoxin family protein [Cryobacterium adonitolivorans]TFC00420.1 thioredoxin [Cryobacterium adonitolivorans]
MNPAAAMLVLVLLVALTTVLGLVWRRRQGRVSVSVSVSDDSADVVTAAQLGLSASSSPPVFGSEATLLQFSTEFCARCPGTSVLLGQVADARIGVRHVDVDLTHRADLARRFNVLQTPTTLVLDRAGRVRARVGGVPNRAALHAHLDDLALDVQEFP